MHPFWFFLALLLACIAAHFICGVQFNSRRAPANYNPLCPTTEAVQSEANGAAQQGQMASPR